MPTLLTQLPGLIWTTDRELQITEFTGSDVKRFALEKLNVQGANIAQLVPYIDVVRIYGDVNDIAEAHRQALQGKTIICEASFRGIDIWFRLRIVPYLDADDTIIGCLGTAFDIYQNKHIEHLLEQREVERRLTQQSLDNARTELEQRIQERTVVLRELNNKLIKEIEIREQAEATARREQAISEGLRQVALILSSTLDLDSVLQRILDTLETVVPHNTAEIVLLKNGALRVVKFHGDYLNQTYIDWMTETEFTVDEYPTYRTIIASDEPLLIPDVLESQIWRPQPNSTWIRSYVGARIAFDGHVFGCLNLSAKTPGFFTEHHADLLKVFAAQAAVAIRNAQYHEQSQSLAILEERQLLARELHDAVSQTLLSAHMFAESLSRIVERDPTGVTEGLNYLRRTIRGALAELRALLVELRPASLLQANLKTLIEQLAEAVASRKEIDIQLEQVNEYNLPDTVKVVVYRVVQEALNNIVKHAYARQIVIHIQHIENSGIELCVSDDGRGFDMRHITSDHMGLAIMQERANEINAHLTIESRVGIGTKIVFTWTPV
ncbi:MAG: GAF domain-containing protein [Anaerolineae bacterium]|nr:GAF domain-containing protein [Anaerolineae bacterium]